MHAARLTLFQVAAKNNEKSSAKSDNVKAANLLSLSFLLFDFVPLGSFAHKNSLLEYQMLIEACIIQLTYTQSAWKYAKTDSVSLVYRHSLCVYGNGSFKSGRPIFINMVRGKEAANKSSCLLMLLICIVSLSHCKQTVLSEAKNVLCILDIYSMLII